MPTLVITNRNYSSWSTRAWLALKQMGYAFEERRVAMGEDFDRQLSELGAAGRVPVLLDGPLRIWESLAICEYGHEQTGRGWPLASADRAAARSLAAEIHAGFPALRRDWPFNLRRRAPRLATPEQQGEIERLRQLAETVRGPFLFGDFSIADAFLAVSLLRLRSYGQETNPAYLNALLQLPALQEWTAAAEAESEVVAKYEV